MISVFGWPDPNTGFDQSEHALYTCYFTKICPKFEGSLSTIQRINPTFDDKKGVFQIKEIVIVISGVASLK